MNRPPHEVRGNASRDQYPPLPRRSPLPPSGASASRSGQYRPRPAPKVRLGEDRYRPGSRRTTSEPLSASWRPQEDPDDEPKRPRKKKSGLAKLTKTYGWRVYALPVLVVITALVVFNTATGPPEPLTETTQGAPGQANGQGDGGPTERPAAPVNVSIPTAELPNGGNVTEAGKGTYHTVAVPPGAGKKIGTGGKLYTYTVDIEDGIDPAELQGDDTFGNIVENILSDPRSWTGTGGVSFQRVGANSPDPDFRVSLTTLNTTKRPDVCGFDIPYPTSCYIKGFDHRVVINLSRWIRGAKAFGGDMGNYRIYAINHEVGHAVGKSHVGCKENGGLAPVMMQQTFGVANNYVAQLNQVDQYNSKAVPADGKTCRFNPWPNLEVGDSKPN
ncbi:DUF3152 domain-containing protein [Amycolatopsis minnesotensis]|uniref:DUF3152 domain-containing protein n=1 Tax=Amycolatopsis minnesotensis TaxID=337894 RepID=A0ABN2RJ71_9PSEU